MLGPATGIVSTILLLLIMAIFVRVILTYFAGMSYSPAGRYLALATDWLIDPIRRVVPPAGGMDFSPAIAILLLYAIRIVIGTGDLVAALIYIVKNILVILIILLLVRIFLGFFQMDPWHPIVQMVARTSEPFARPFRRWLPRRRTGFDWAPVAALVALMLVWAFVNFLDGLLHRPF